MALGQDVAQRVQLLGQLAQALLEALVVLRQLGGPLLGQQDAAPRLVPALAHGDVVPLAPQPVLHAVLADGPLGHGRAGPRGPQPRREAAGPGGQHVRGELLLENVRGTCGEHVMNMLMNTSMNTVVNKVMNTVKNMVMNM